MVAINPSSSKVDTDDFKNIIFTAGPIQGSADWQYEFINYFTIYDDSLLIANPRRDKMSPDFNYNFQVDWESQFLYKSNILVFWLPNEIEKIEGRQYAQTTRFELGEWFGRIISGVHNKHIIVGVEDGFSGKRYIKNKFARMNVDVQDSLDNVIKQVCTFL